MQVFRTNALYREMFHNDRLAIFLMAGIVGTVAAVESWELFQPETIYNGYDNFVKSRLLPSCSYDSLPYARSGISWYLVCVSDMALGNARIIPFVESLALIPATFFMVRRYSGSFPALLTSAGLALNPAFLIFDTSAAYPQLWSLLFILFVYAASRSVAASLGIFVMASWAKAIPVAWAPIIAFGIYRSNYAARQKALFSGAILGIFVLVFATSFENGSNIFYSALQLHWPDPHMLYYWTASAFRWNEFIPMLSPAILGIYAVWYKKWNLPHLPFQLLAGSWIVFAVISGFTMEGYYPYRTIPNVVFFLWSCSVLVSLAATKIFLKHQN